MGKNPFKSFKSFKNLRFNRDRVNIFFILLMLNLYCVFSLLNCSGCGSNGKQTLPEHPLTPSSPDKNKSTNSNLAISPSRPPSLLPSPPSFSTTKKPQSIPNTSVDSLIAPLLILDSIDDIETFKPLSIPFIGDFLHPRLTIFIAANQDGEVIINDNLRYTWVFLDGDAKNDGQAVVIITDKPAVSYHFKTSGIHKLMMIVQDKDGKEKPVTYLRYIRVFDEEPKMI